jgi:polyphosphate glucokinase
MAQALGVDIGGSGIKAAVVDTARAELTSERLREPTPPSLEPEDVLPAVESMIERFSGVESVGVGFPAVVEGGVPQTPFTAVQVASWVGLPVAKRLGESTGRRVVLLNDADAAGLAEMAFGRGSGQRGTALVLTLGTGIGSALFVDGQLVPNVELGHLYLQGHTEVAEQYASDAARKRDDLRWKEYAGRLDEYLARIERLFSPRLIILGGGISKRAHKLIPKLTVRAEVVPALLRNEAGIIGAAVAAARA